MHKFEIYTSVIHDRMAVSHPIGWGTVPPYPGGHQEHVEGGGCESEGMDEGLGTDTCKNTVHIRLVHMIHSCMGQWSGASHNVGVVMWSYLSDARCTQPNILASPCQT